MRLPTRLALCARSGAAATETVAQSIGDHDPGFANAEDREVLRHLLGHLTVRERLSLSLRFRRGLTQRGIAESLGISQMTVSRVLRQVLARLREMADDDLAPAHHPPA
jgi:RNA polymerase sigma-B factor